MNNRFGRSSSCAGVAELADAYGSDPYGGYPMKVQVLSPAPKSRNLNTTFLGSEVLELRDFVEKHLSK